MARTWTFVRPNLAYYQHVIPVYPSLVVTWCLFGIFQISHFKIPKFVHFISEYPLTTSGKVKKFVLREQAVDIFGDQNKAEKEVQKEVP